MQIYNTVSQKKEDFKTLQPNTVKIYTCGQTVYNDIHMGNARFYVAFDAIRRYLEHQGHTVHFVQNLTDIDDKIIEKANAEGVTTAEISKKYIESTLQDLDALGVKRATKNPLATQEIPEIIQMIKELIDKNSAYPVQGTVYFDITAFKNYGKLSRKNIEELEAGARIEVETNKKHPGDFVLWKPAKPGEPAWDSPWGQGRPGWHIECSAMARKYLGDEIDIHGGGSDLVFPHHENEIAQSETVTGKTFAKYWMHCGILTVEHKKMSKSRGNFATLKEVAQKFPYDVIRFFFLSGHYRMPMEFTDTVLKAAAQGLARIKNCYANLLLQENTPPTMEKNQAPIAMFEAQFTNAMDDDFNTADAIAALFEMVRYANTNIQDINAPAFAASLFKCMGILGLDIRPATATSQNDAPEDDGVNALIAQRQTARKNKDFAESDRIRDLLLGMGIVLEDTRDGGVRWHRG